MFSVMTLLYGLKILKNQFQVKVVIFLVFRAIKIISSGETVILKFEIRILEGKLPSVLTFTYDLIRNSHLSTIAYAIVCVNSRITFVTNEVLASKHDCLYGQYETYSKWLKSVFYKDFDYLKKLPKRFSGCKYLNSGYYLIRPKMSQPYCHMICCYVFRG
jgi:hypothetical protein